MDPILAGLSLFYVLNTMLPPAGYNFSSMTKKVIWWIVSRALLVEHFEHLSKWWIFIFLPSIITCCKIIKCHQVIKFIIKIVLKNLKQLTLIIDYVFDVLLFHWKYFQCPPSYAKEVIIKHKKPPKLLTLPLLQLWEQIMAVFPDLMYLRTLWYSDLDNEASNQRSP